jgi:hypothetical protein
MNVKTLTDDEIHEMLKGTGIKWENGQYVRIDGYGPRESIDDPRF